MFSGIVEELGVVNKKIKYKNKDEIDEGGDILSIKSNIAAVGATEGCSISVNGVCLTLVKTEKIEKNEENEKTDLLSFDVAPETLRRSNLKYLSEGSLVNLERGLGADSRNSGHFVQGHIDEMGKIIDKSFEHETLWLEINVNQSLLKYIVNKGFIGLDGTSLTVCEKDENSFKLMVIPHTQKHSVIAYKEIGDWVNIEVDVMSKYAHAVTQALEERVAQLEKKIN
eukprot:GHVL01005647.1.p1 GENE.GHVL01005647.1~~GHVL01005647.1.p1  ORF type:complete len:226 (+),score=57.48 GHVL01005647.1:167-844(+)